ncbi:MAG: amidohydrolase, partial [Synergistaceae bacterium]|nr:amidohydrolase [Synergistaceae bacterium]
MKELLKKKTAEKASDVIRWRRQIHEYPELSNEEFETAKLIEEKLRSFGIDSIKRIGKSGTGVFAELRGTGEGPGICIGIRADIDALPIQEQSGVSY